MSAHAREQVLRRIGGDREDSPWMVSTEPHLFLVIALLQALQRVLARRGGWHVGGEVFVVFGPAPDDQVAPDVYAAPVADYPRTRYVVAEEGLFPPFVVEVVSADSRTRDLEEKVALYEALGVQEYVIVAPGGEEHLTAVQLEGYRREADGRFAVWRPDAEGCLWSALLDVWLCPEGEGVRVLNADGTAVLSLEEVEDARRAAQQEYTREAAARQAAEEERAREAAARQIAEEERAREAAARRDAEAEIARLPAELQRYRDHS
jgi:Uma2 family endonuclease